jgi:glycosyltransferase involved in cell wall biosynthesis
VSTATSLLPLRVLTIAHNAVAASNRQREVALAALPGIELALLTPPWWDEEGRRIQAAPAEHAWWRVGRTVMTGNGTRHLYAQGLPEAIRAARPDVIDLYEEPFSLVALQTLLLRDLVAPRAALVFYSAVNVWRRWRWPYRTIERLLVARADGAHAPNQDVPQILRSKGFSRQPIATVPLGVDAERFAAEQCDTLPTIPRPRVGFVGRLEPVKGLDVLIEAFQRHLATSTASLVIAGDGSERFRLASLIGAKCTPRRIELLPSVSYDRMPAFLKSLDVLVLPSVTILPLHREQFGRVLVEAMAAGVPVVGSSSGAIPETIGDAGLVVPERDAPALAWAIDRVLNEAGLRDALVQHGLRRVRQSFAWPVIAEQTAALLRAAVTHRRHAQADLPVVLGA